MQIGFLERSSEVRKTKRLCLIVVYIETNNNLLNIRRYVTVVRKLTVAQSNPRVSYIVSLLKLIKIIFIHFFIPRHNNNYTTITHMPQTEKKHQ